MIINEIKDYKPTTKDRATFTLGCSDCGLKMIGFSVFAFTVRGTAEDAVEEVLKGLEPEWKEHEKGCGRPALCIWKEE